MNLPRVIIGLALFLTCLVGTHTAASTTNVIQLGGLPAATCGVPFMHDGVTLVFTNSALGEGAEGFCSFDTFSTGLALYPGNLQVGLGQFTAGLERVEADFQDNCGKGCSRLILALGSSVVAMATNAVGFAEGTLILEVVPGSVDTLYLSSFEGSFHQIRVVSQANPAPPSLNVKWSGNELVLTWPSSGSDCRLQSAGLLNTPTAWTPVNQVPVTTPDGFEVRLVPGTPVSYYRLECP